MRLEIDSPSRGRKLVALPVPEVSVLELGLEIDSPSRGRKHVLELNQVMNQLLSV